MPQCRCGDLFPVERAKQGYTLCKACNAPLEEQERQAKFKRTAADGNKQGATYQGDAETARRNIKQAGKKTATVEADDNFRWVTPRESFSPAPQPRRQQVGVYWIGPQCYVWFEGDNPAARGATRQARYR